MCRFSPDDYVIAAVSLYLDFINLFIRYFYEFFVRKKLGLIQHCEF